MGKMLYLEGFSGIAGDMTVAALLALGGSREKLDLALKSLALDDEFSYGIATGKSYGIAGTVFNVICHHDHPHDHDHAHDRAHDHSHDHDHVHSHGHIHRNLADIMQIVNRAQLSVRARKYVENIFRIVAEAEAAAHGCSIEEVHFHEVGAIDSIVDIVSAAVLLDDLDIDQCIVEALSEGQGIVKCQHGVLPVPVPAVLNIAQKHNIALRRTPVQGEMVTPTGIAIAAALRTGDKLPEKYRIKAVGIGVGKRDFGHANILRAMLIEAIELPSETDILVMECNIDDCSGEMLGLAMEKLLAAGALEVNYTPCFMKKNRPGYSLQIIAGQRDVEKLEQLVFENTTTIGIRRYPVERCCMQRNMVELHTIYGKVAAKRCVYKNIERIYPEYESVKALAASTSVPFYEVWQAAVAAAGTV